MGKKDARVDAYIEKSADFAKPILKRLRKLVHQGCPEVVEEIKWGSPHFNYRGMFCGMAAFKEHCAFGFWNRALKIEKNEKGMGQFGCLRTVADLPDDAAVLGYVRRAAALADEGIQLGPVRRAKKPLPVPPALTAALRKREGALAKFKAFSPSAQREYSEWILEAKTDATRDKRLATAAAWIADGKRRNWKYERG
ncbi:MAG TPA: YdeI/OmpD-associated family protein [Thermoanaerobaculia bacterium]|jgi:hypothetical protein